VKVSRIVTVLLLTLAIVMMSSSAFAQKPPETATLKAAPGDVTFNHAAHVKVAGKCDVCHHAAKPEKAPTSKFEKCADCHTKTVAAPMKTDAKTAFHKNCIDCHKAQGKGPQKCQECHKK
jgi:hypothetical protein